jgi:hypothetical protein
MTSLLWWLVPLAAVLAAAAVVAREFQRKNAGIWLPAYLRRRIPRVTSGPVHVMFCFVDHFEPKWGRPSAEVETRRVQEWCDRYARLASRHRDADGVAPQHTFFYPEEEYETHHLDALERLCRDGFGEIEVHLHHDNDTADGLREKITRFGRILHERHGALPRHRGTGRMMFGFIHGNWALDNSRCDGRWCGVNDELQVLSELGCYADFTLPSAPSDTQTRKINSIYHATDDPNAPRSHDSGVDVTAGRPGRGDRMIVQGPLALNWRRRKWGVIPRIENADVRATNPPTTDRIDLWVKQHVHVQGRPEWVFVKVHTHGCQEADMETLLGAPADAMFDHLERRYNDGARHVLHYVNSRELYNIVRAAEDGHAGDPGRYRDYELAPPATSPRFAGQDVATMAGTA